MRLLGLVVTLILAAAQSSVSLGQERHCDGDCSDKAPLPPGEGAVTPTTLPAATSADDKQRRPPPPPDEAKPPPVESDVALHFTNHVHVTLNDTWDPPGHVHRDVVVENGSSLNYAASFLSHTVTGDDGEDVEPATPASVLNNTIALGEDGSKVKVLLDSSNNLKEPDLFHDEDTARAAKVQTPSTASVSEGKLEADATTALPEAPEQLSSKNDTNRETFNKEDHPPEIVVTQKSSKNVGTTTADKLPDVVVTQEPLTNNNTSMSRQEPQDTEKVTVTVNNKTEITTKPPLLRNGADTNERRSSTRLVIKKVTKAEPEDDEGASTPLPRENKIYHGSSRRRTQEVTTLRPRRRGTTTQQPESPVSTTLRSFRRKSYTDAAVAVETITAAMATATRRRPSEEDSEETMVRVELSTLPPRRSSFRPVSTTTTRTVASSTISSTSSASTSRGRVKFFDSSSSRTTTTPSSATVSSSMVPMRRLLLPPTPSPGTSVQEPRPFSLGMQENKHVAVHVPAPPTTTAMTTTQEDFTTSSSTVIVEDAWTTEDDEDTFFATTTNRKANASSEVDDDEAVSTTMTWPMTTTMVTKSPDRATSNESESTFIAMTDPVTTDRPEEASTLTAVPTERGETQQDRDDDGEDTSTTLTTTVTSPYETSCYATLWASGVELCRRLGDVRGAFVAALKANSQQDDDDDREVPPLSGWDMSLRLQDPKACEGVDVTGRHVEVTVRGLPDGCVQLLDLWHADNLASPFQVKQFRVSGVEPPGFDGHRDDLEDHNTTVNTTAATTTTSAVDEEEKTTVATTTEEVPPPALSGGGGEDGNNAGVVAAIVVSSVGGVCLVLLAVLLVVLRRRQRRFRSYGQRCTPVSLDAYSLDSVSVGDAASVRSRRKGVLRASKRSYGNAAFTLDERDPASPSHPLSFAGLAAFCADNSAAVEAEFALVPQVSVASDELPPGADVKNRYANVTPLPETRVQLSRRGDDPLSTYINANYVKGPEGEPRFYIATQAPMASTVTDFWRMVWEQQSRTILMATLLVENGVERCCDYLPPSEVLDCHRVFGDFQITLKKRDQKDHYVVSTLQIKNLETNLWREVTHLWLVSWPCEGVPEDPRSVVAFLVEARPFTKAAGPVVVHCSPGTGRTGTLIACDVLLRHFETTRTVDVPRCVAAIRRERAGAVKTPQQYVFIYKLLNLYAAMLTGGALDSL